MESVTEDVLEVLAPRDEELNPDGDRGSVPQHVPTGDARRSDRRAKKRKSRWDEAPKEGNTTVVIKPPRHCKEMQNCCSGDNDRNELLQKILFTDFSDFHYRCRHHPSSLLFLRDSTIPRCKALLFQGFLL